jgi:hypothetical protein
MPSPSGKLRLRREDPSFNLPATKLTQNIHDLVDETPEDAPLPRDVRELRQLNHAIADVREGRDYSVDQFMKKVEQQWPRNNLASG